MKTIAIIPSGGRGTRIGYTLPKQYIKINSKELIAYILHTFQSCNLVDEIIVASETQYFDLLFKLKDKYNFTKIIKIVEGGNKRQDSVYNALLSTEAADDDLIIIHDAARPLLSNELLKKAIHSAGKFDSVVVAIKAHDTLLKGKQTVKEYISRDDIYYVQTPQIFRYKILLEAMQKAKEDNFYGTDESMLVKRASCKIHIVKGETLNFKITTKADLEMFKKLVHN